MIIVPNLNANQDPVTKLTFWINLAKHKHGTPCTTGYYNKPNIIQS